METFSGIFIATLIVGYLSLTMLLGALQFIGGRFIAKLKAASFGSAFKILMLTGLISSSITYGALEFMSSDPSLMKQFLHPNGILFLAIAVLLLFILTLVLVTKRVWKCQGIGSALKASLVTIIVQFLFAFVIAIMIGESYPG